LVVSGGGRKSSSDRRRSKPSNTRTYDLVNQYRQKLGLNPVVWSKVIGDRAILHSDKMATEGQHSPTPALRVAPVPSHGLARVEHIRMNWSFRDHAEKFVEGWIQSLDHRKNLKAQFNLMDIARSEEGSCCATQLVVLTP
jgi:uncharacterized protein YkwD